MRKENPSGVPPRHRRHLFNEEAFAVFQRLQRQRIRIGSQDLRIVAIAFLHGFTIVTSNVRDFFQIPHLTIEDWTSASQ